MGNIEFCFDYFFDHRTKVEMNGVFKAEVDYDKCDVRLWELKKLYMDHVDIYELLSDEAVADIESQSCDQYITMIIKEWESAHSVRGEPTRFARGDV